MAQPAEAARTAGAGGLAGRDLAVTRFVEERMQEQAAICEICGDPIYVEVGREHESASWLGGFSQAVERAAAAHIATHPTPVVERFLLRKHLDEIAPDVRPAAVKQVYAELREIWGDEDRRGMYSIDDVLGAVTIYRLWLDASRCTWDRCRHDV